MSSIPTKSLVIFHYHLLRGGVRSSIEKSLRSLWNHDWFKNLRIRLLVGKEEGAQSFLETFRHKQLKLEAVVDERLDYRDEPWPDEDSFKKDLINLSRWLLSQGKQETIFWIHNPTLGKNPLVTAAWFQAANVAEQENLPYRFLYHIHDFAECGRLQNLIRLANCWRTGGISDYYPNADNVGYAVLNSTDVDKLREAGIPGNRIFYLPNVVSPTRPLRAGLASEEKLNGPLSTFAQRNGYRFEKDRPRWLLPIRLIRRKNVLESLLLQAISDVPPQLLLTLDANSAQEIPYAETVKSLVKELHLPVVIGFGHELVGTAFSFEELMESAEAILTTSLLEGFGFAFLDGPMHGKPLIGRNLPHVTVDYQNTGASFEGLYDRFLVPLAQRERHRLTLAAHKFTNKLKPLLKNNGAALEAFVGKLESVYGTREVDFGMLDLDAQKRVVANITDSRFTRLLKEMNRDAPRPVIFSKRFGARILDSFGPEPYAKRLNKCFTGLFDLPEGSYKSHNTSQKLIELFLDPAYQKPLLGGWE